MEVRYNMEVRFLNHIKKNRYTKSTISILQKSMRTNFENNISNLIIGNQNQHQHQHQHRDEV